eukprot:5585428-Amphidinium_carterae.1
MNIYKEIFIPGFFNPAVFPFLKSVWGFLGASGIHKAYFTVGGEIMADSRKLYFGDMVSWPLSGDRKLTVPCVLQESVKSALLDTRSRGIEWGPKLHPPGTTPKTPQK